MKWIKLSDRLPESLKLVTFKSIEDIDELTWHFPKDYSICGNLTISNDYLYIPITQNSTHISKVIDKLYWLDEEEEEEHYESKFTNKSVTGKELDSDKNDFINSTERNTIYINVSGYVGTGKSRLTYLIKQFLKSKGFEVEHSVNCDFINEEEFDKTMQSSLDRMLADCLTPYRKISIKDSYIKRNRNKY